MEVIESEELVGMESSLVEAVAVEGHVLVCVVEERSETGGLIAPQQTEGSEAFHKEAS
jgi:hypothetical protein